MSMMYNFLKYSFIMGDHLVTTQTCYCCSIHILLKYDFALAYVWLAFPVLIMLCYLFIIMCMFVCAYYCCYEMLVCVLPCNCCVSYVSMTECGLYGIVILFKWSVD